MFTTAAHRAQLQKLECYVAAATYLSSIGWKQAGSGNVIANKKTGELQASIIVGKILDHRLFTGPVGSYRPEYGSLSGAKFSFILGRPDEPSFAVDYDQGFDALTKMQASCAATKDRRNLLVTEGQTRNIKFSAPVFEQRELSLQPPVSNHLDELRYPDDEELNADVDEAKDEEVDVTANSSKVDEETENWPVPSAHEEEMATLKYTHQVRPLPVYRGNEYIEPLLVTNALRESLVEVHFSVKHFTIGGHQNNNGNAFDSYSGIIEQVIILKPGPPKSANAYKRKNIREGPFRPKPPPMKSIEKAPSKVVIPKPGNVAATNVASVEVVKPGSGESSESSKSANKESHADVVDKLTTTEQLLAKESKGVKEKEGGKEKDDAKEKDGGKEKGKATDKTTKNKNKNVDG